MKTSIFNKILVLTFLLVSISVNAQLWSPVSPAKAQAKSKELRASAEAVETSTRAEAAEAYAAAMSKFALSVQNEAEKAVAFAAETKGKSPS